MTFSEEHNERVIRLLKNDAERRNYIREYMKEYRRNKKEETGTSQKQYHTTEYLKIKAKENYYKKTASNDIKNCLNKIYRFFL